MRLRLIISAIAALAMIPLSQAAPIDIEVGQRMEGTLDAQDTEAIIDTCARADSAFLRDVYRMAAPPHSEIEVLIESEFDAYLYLYDSDGNLMDENDDHLGTRSSRIVHSVGDSPACYAVVTTFAQGTSGDYSITVGHTGPEAPSSEPKPMAIGEPVQGYLVPGDMAPLRGDERAGELYQRDALRIDVEEPGSFHVDVTANFDAYIYLTDLAGNILAQNDDGESQFQSHLIHEALVPGPVNLVVTSFAPLRGGTWSYSVTSGWGEQEAVEAAPAPLPGWPIASANAD